MPTIHLFIALLGLLLTPGPSNTLMLLSGADSGLRASLRLIPAELAAYLCVVVPLVLLAGAAAGPLDALRPVIAVGAGLWVLLLAVRLWRTPPATGKGTFVTPRAVFLTTVLNPKALIIGLVLLPGVSPATGLAAFALIVVAVALFWAGLGAGLPRKAGSGLPVTLRRAAACWLAVVSFGLLANGLAT